MADSNSYIVEISELYNKINMPILTIIIVLIIVGVLLLLANRYIPMDAMIKKIINIVVIVAVVLWLLKVFGVWDYLSKVTV